MSRPEYSPEYLLEYYDFQLPEELIAQKPIERRDASRLMVIDRSSGKIEHHVFSQLSKFLTDQDVLVANNTRVIKARLLGQRIREEAGARISGGKVELVLLEEVAPRTWEGLFKASARYVPGVSFEIPTPDGRGLRGVLVRGSGDSPHGTVVAEFDRDPLQSGAGELPLPHYIERPASAEDETRYQTVYAKVSGSAAAPTAGLHFTDSIRQELRAQGVSWEELTLHVGLGTFRPVKETDIRKHLMHEERYEISGTTAERLTRARVSGKRIVAVGTTTVRTLESAWKDGQLPSGSGRTSIFIRPGAHRFQCVDRMITNFHLPKSTLLMLVSAFAGRELILRAYEEAVRERYRFFSYGDAMLIL